MLDAHIPMKDLAKATLLSGNLTEIQTHNIQMLAYVVFSGIDTLETEYDINTNRDKPEIPSTVTYHIRFKKGHRQPNKTEAKKLLTYLEQSMPGILWPGIQIKVFNKRTGKQLGE